MMKNVIKTIRAACSMFSAIPVPQTEWTEENMRFLLAAFPLIGVVIGVCEVFFLFLADRFSFPGILTAACAVVIPIVLTGGIHHDGYLDVSDAISSFGDAEKRRTILADPHIGSFAVIRLTLLLLLNLGCVSALSFRAGQMLLFGCSFVVSRCLSGLAVAIFPLSKDTGLAHTFQSTADRRMITLWLGGELLAAVCVMLIGGGIAGGGICAAEAILMLSCAAGQWLYMRKTAARVFGGLSGDLNGWFLVKAELWMLSALAFMQLAFR